MPNVNVKTDYGAGGAIAATTGSITSGSTTLTVASVPAGVVVGSGLGIAGAGSNTTLSAPYFPNPALRARVTNISGTTITLDKSAGATVTGAVVSVDDSLPIQAALDYVAASGGGTVTVPAGTYVIGTPDAPDNAPLFVGSSTVVAGAGRDQTILRLCDRAAQISLGLNSADSSAVPDAGYQYPNAAVIVNKANIWWHQNQPWLLSDPLHDPYVTPDHDLTLQDLTLDGNAFNQPANFVPGNRTGGAIPDLRAFPLVAAVTVPTQASPFLNGHFYDVQTTYADANGNENFTPHTVVQIPASGSYGLQFTFCTPPAGAVSQFLYICDFSVNPLGTTWNYATWAQGSNLDTARVWRKIALSGVQAAGSTYTVQSYVPPSQAVSASAAGNITRSGSTVTATFASAHAFVVGDYVNVSPGETFLPAGLYTVASVPSTTSITFTSTGSAGSSTASQTITGVTTAHKIVAAGGLSRTGSTVTTTFASAHAFAVGDYFTILPGEPSFPQGTYQVASVPSSTSITFASAGSAGTSTYAQKLACDIYAPGWGGIGTAAATCQYGIFLDNCARALVQRLKITNMTFDGITLTSADMAYLSATPPHAVTDSQFIDVQISSCAREALGITGPAQRILYDHVSCGDCYWGLDIEADSAAGGVNSIVFRNCRFAGSWQSAGVQLAAFEASPILGVLFTGCEFDDNMSHVAISTNEVCACFTGCRFTNSGSAAFGCNAIGRVFVIGNYFEFSGREHPPIPDEFTGEIAYGALLFGTPADTTAMVVSDNVFVGEPDPLAVMITVQSPHSAIVANNDFRVVQKKAFNPAVFVPDPSPALSVLNQPVLVTNNTGLYRLTT